MKSSGMVTTQIQTTMLAIEDYQTLTRIRNKIAHQQQVSNEEVTTYINLIQKDGERGKKEIQNLMQKTGAKTTNELAQKLSSKKNESLLEGLVYVGLGILLGYALIKALKE